VEALTPREAVEGMEIRAPSRGNRRLEALLAAANADERLRAWWRMQEVTANRLGMSDHSWLRKGVYARRWALANSRRFGFVVATGGQEEALGAALHRARQWDELCGHDAAAW
jgi:hypothetical protein